MLREWAASAVGASVRRQAPLPVEASHRRFHRIWCRDSTFVVMNSPPSEERNGDFIAMQRLFSQAGVPVPEIIAMDTNAGWFLLTDLGDRQLEQAYAGPDRERALTLAIDQLVRIQEIEARAVPPYEESRFRDELNIFVDWFLGGLLDESPSSTLTSVFETLIDNILRQPRCLIHRDYHCRNLLLNRQGSFGIVDFQDALVGPCTYDLACLLWDCYYHFDEPERQHWLARYQNQTRLDFEVKTLPRMLDLTALQRQFKAVGIFSRLWRRDGKITHLAYIGPVLEDMQRIAVKHLPSRRLSAYLGQLAAKAGSAIKGAP